MKVYLHYETITPLNINVNFTAQFINNNLNFQKQVRVEKKGSTDNRICQLQISQKKKKGRKRPAKKVEN